MRSKYVIAEVRRCRTQYEWDIKHWNVHNNNSNQLSLAFLFAFVAPAPANRCRLTDNYYSKHNKMHVTMPMMMRSNWFERNAFLSRECFRRRLIGGVSERTVSDISNGRTQKVFFFSVNITTSSWHANSRQLPAVRQCSWPESLAFCYRFYDSTSQNEHDE